ncbi:MAG: hypothetical protein FWG13_04355 [Leptospirales bacterium]|nr:hypothetical protein [Leptospirales bacterium]
MEEPKVSPDFTIEDIHKIREYNHEITKNMTLNERKEYYNAKAEKVKKEITKLKNSKSVKV